MVPGSRTPPSHALALYAAKLQKGRDHICFIHPVTPAPRPWRQSVILMGEGSPRAVRDAQRAGVERRKVLCSHPFHNFAIVINESL